MSNEDDEVRAAFAELTLLEEELRQTREMAMELLETGPIDGSELAEHIRCKEGRRVTLRKKLGLE